ncbi:MAG: hypothetical protein WC136_09835 [Sphaerochaeta sp.]|jgi:hypothetical protein
MLDEIKIPENKQTKLGSALNVLNTMCDVRTSEVDLPILRTSCEITPLTGSEDLTLKTLRASGSTFVRNFNKLIYDHTKFKNIEFESFEDFQNNLTPPDKSMLVFGLLDSTFKTLPEKVITCPHCKKSDTYHFHPSDIVHSDTFTKEWTHPMDYTVSSEVSPGVTLFYGMPTEKDKLSIIDSKSNGQLRKNLEDEDDILNNVDVVGMYIKKIEIRKGKEVITLTDKKEEIIPLLNDCPFELKLKIIEDETISQFTDYVPNYYLNIVCKDGLCAKEFKWDNINPENDFFRKALSIYN